MEIFNEDDIKKTDTWELFEKGRNYLRRMNVYTDTDINYRMYNGDQWYGANIEGIEKAQYNFIETIVNYKVSTINQNLYAIHYSSENFERKEFRKNAKKVCDLLDKKAAKVWEKDQMDIKVRSVSDDAAINDEGVMYVYYDEDTQSPVNEILNKNDIQFGNEQSSEIQSQPYIIISRRKPVTNIRELAKSEGCSESDLKYIVSDNDMQDQPGTDAKYEKDDMVTYVTKMWKQDGTVWYQSATKYVDIEKPKDSGLTLYPVSHFIWKDKKGWSRGEGEVRTLIPNQLELNKTLARSLLAIKQCAYAQKVVNQDKIANPTAVNQVGGVIKTKNGASVEDVSKIFTYIQPASMSTDVSRVMSDLISITRELKNAGDIATGGINPEQASGKAILAVQQASQQPLTKQAVGLKRFIEDIARIWLDMWTIYTPKGMQLEEETTDPETGEEYTQLVNVPASMLENLKGTVRIDITPTSPYDKYARELSIENMFKAGMFNVQRLAELKIYVDILPDDSTMPKQELLDAIEKMEEEQERIAMINAQAQMMQQRASQFINGDIDQQANMVNDAQQMINQAQ
ncbi:MAG: hypothetical protein II625_11180 [Bacilli bacterium]|nr:hypothetical protein [Bacilli bacterium]